MVIRPAAPQAYGDPLGIEAAEKRLRDAVVTAPLEGTDLLETREPGETLAPGRLIVRPAELNHMWLRVYVAETEIDRVELGQRVEVTIDAASIRTFSRDVTDIAQEAELTPKNVQTREQRVKLVFRVKIGLANPGGELQPGMPAEVQAIIDSTDMNSAGIAAGYVGTLMSHYDRRHRETMRAGGVSHEPRIRYDPNLDSVTCMLPLRYFVTIARGFFLRDVGMRVL